MTQGTPAPGHYDTPAISYDELVALGETIREAKRDKSDPEQGVNGLVGQCHVASEAFVKEFKKQHPDAPWPEVREMQIGEQRVTHFVVAVPIEAVDVTTFPDNLRSLADPWLHGQHGYVLVDPTIRQFCDTEWQNGNVEVNLGTLEMLPSIGVYLPGDEERTVWYRREKQPWGERDCFAPIDRRTDTQMQV